MSVDEDLIQNIKKVDLKGDLNILLLGETGVGKSTFVNALANYLSFKDFKTAEAGPLVTLIPNQFTIEDKDGKRHKVQIGKSDKNENIKPGESATQDVKTYVFPIYNDTVKLRIIDTPGLLDTRGIDQDKINYENILSYLSQIHDLHAICILLKPTNTRLTAGFDYCIKELLSHLHKSAVANIIFCFTNTRGSNFAPGESHTCIEQIINTVKTHPPHAEIPFDKNIFCFDSEPYLYLAANSKNIKLDNKIKVAAILSWDKSSKECKKLLCYIHGDKNTKSLVPHLVKNTISINKIRKMIDQLSKPLLDISENIEHNIRLLKRHQQRMSSHDQTLEELKANLYIPVMQLNEIKLPHPVTVCANTSCVEVLKVDGIKTTDYKTECHPKCYLNGIAKELVGDAGLQNCSAMDSSKNCRICSCSFMSHMHIYYKTKKVPGRIVDKTVEKKITTKQQAIEQCQINKEQMEKRVKDLQAEHDQVVEATALFAHFLQNNAITPFNDSYSAYIEYLITRERYYGPKADQETILHLTNLKTQYSKIKKTFDEAQKKDDPDMGSPTKISNKIENLFKLPLMGAKINELYKVQKTARKTEYKDTEYVHKPPPTKSSTSKPPKQQEKSKKPTPKPTESGVKAKANKAKPPTYNEAVGLSQSTVPDSPRPLVPPPVGHPPQPPHSSYPPPSHVPTHYPVIDPYPSREADRISKLHITVENTRPYPEDPGYGYDRRPPYYPERGHDPYPERGYGHYPERGPGPYPAHGYGHYPDRGHAPYPERGHAPYPERGTAPYPERGPAPYPVHGPAPYPERGPAPYPERGPAPYPERGPAPYPVRSPAPYPERGAGPYYPPKPDYQPPYNPNYPHDRSPQPPGPAGDAPPRNYSGYGGSTSYSKENANRRGAGPNRGGARTNKGDGKSHREDAKSNRGAQRGTRGRGRGNFKRNVNHKGKPKNNSDSDDSDTSSVFSYTKS